MRQEAQNWWRQSQDDFDAAKYNYNGKKFFVAAFLCQQATEKALKALFLHKHKGAVPQSHSLIYLAKETGVPARFFSFLRELTPKFVDTRYPDAAVDLPSLIYDKDNTQMIINSTRGVLQWVAEELR